MGLRSAEDIAIWTYARDRGFLIASKDSDFRQLGFTHGAPPKVIWIRRGNCSVPEVAAILRDRYAEVLAFQQDPQGTFLALS